MTSYKCVGKCLLIERHCKKLLAIGDLHLGYEEILNRTGVYVSEKLFEENIAYLEGVFRRTGKVDKIILLGDVKHDFGSISKQERKYILRLFEYLTEKSGEVIVVRGNHDVILRPLVKQNAVKLKDYYIFSEYFFFHGDAIFEKAYSKEIRCWVLGHGHPAIKLSDGVKIEKYKCFLFGDYKGRRIIIVPSFFEGNRGTDPRENDLGLAIKFNLGKFNAMIVSNFEVLDFGILNKI